MLPSGLEATTLKMAPKKSANGYNTNLAAEFYVLSVLHRFGADANLTLGNKKSVDIVVVRGAGDTITVDVKGLAGKTGWPVDNVAKGTPGHFLVLVCFLDRIADPLALPEVYVIPSTELESVIYNAPGGRRLVTVSKARKEGARFRDGWKQLL
jgi:hypothetical protein